MDIRPIRNESGYDWALAELTRYFEDQPEPRSPEADRFDVLSDLVEAYENKHWPIEAPDPVEAIKVYMNMHGLKQSNLAEVLGSTPRASDVLRRKRRLSVDMIHRISKSWRIPADMMIAPYRLDNGGKQSRAKWIWKSGRTCTHRHGGGAAPHKCKKAVTSVAAPLHLIG